MKAHVLHNKQTLCIQNKLCFRKTKVKDGCQVAITAMIEVVHEARPHVVAARTSAAMRLPRAIDQKRQLRIPMFAQIGPAMYNTYPLRLG
jgi:hypothetical protein